MADPSVKWLIKRHATMVLAIVMTIGCDSGVSPQDPAVARVDVTLGASTLGVSETIRAVARARDTGGRSLSRAAITWESSNPDIATVTSDGMVTGVSEGTAWITATSGSAAGSAQLQVVNTLPNIRVDFAYLVQVIQNPSGNIPLLQDGNPILVRVFGVVDRPFRPSLTTPIVRITMLHDEQIVAVDERPMTGLPSVMSQAIHEVVMPASLVRPGLRFRVDVNPDSLLPERTLSDNVFPRDGTPFVVDVRRLRPLQLHFVPLVMHSFPNGTVTPEELPFYLGSIQQLHPVSGIDASVSAPVAVSWRGEFGQDGALFEVIGQLDVIRLIEGSTAYHVGVYGRGVTWGGYAYINFDPTNFGPGTHVSVIQSAPNSAIAHELGHNMGRLHAPCSTPALGPDPHYPNEGGVTNISGADLQRWSMDGTFPTERPATMFDFMSYCVPRWVSEYTFRGLLDWRVREDSALAAMPNLPAQRSLIVWGTISGDSIRLEPSFIAKVRPTAPRKPGAFTLNAADERGANLFSLSFDPAVLDHSSTRPFLFAIPLSVAEETALSRLTITGRGRAARREINRAAFMLRNGQEPLAATFRELGRGQSLVTWDSFAHPLVIARDVSSGRVLGIGTSGQMTLATSVDEVELVVSNGLTSFVKVIKRN